MDKSFSIIFSSSPSSHPNREGEKREKQIESLAQELDLLSFQYDTYEYKDTVSNNEENLCTLQNLIATGQTKEILSWLSEIIEEENEYSSKAKELSDAIIRTSQSKTPSLDHMISLAKEREFISKKIITNEKEL